VIALKKRNSNKKFLLGFCALLVVVAMVSVGVTLALTTVDKTYTTNVVTIGEVKIELIDKYYDLDGDKQINKDKAKNGANYYEKTDDADAVPPVFDPNTNVAKTVKVKNIGKFPCYVRLLVYTEWTYSGPDSELPVRLTDKIEWKPSSKWIKGDKVTVDGKLFTCYYYTKIIYPQSDDNATHEKETDGFFTYDDPENGLQQNMFHIGNYNKTFGSQATGHIIVKAQAVQSDYTEGELGDLGDYDTEKTFVRDAQGHIIRWNDLIFE